VEPPGKHRDRSVRTPELLQNTAPGGVRECSERDIDVGPDTLNHMVQCTRWSDGRQWEAVLLAVRVPVGTALQLDAGRRRSGRPGGEPGRTILAMGLLTFAINVTLDGCVDHREGIADDETHDFFTRLMDESGAMLWGRVTYEMMESYWPAVARGAEEAPPAMREWAVKLEAKPKYVVSSTRKDFPWTNSHHIGGDLRVGVQRLKDATPKGVLLGSGKLATELDRLELIDEYKFLVHPRLAGHGPTLYQSGLPATRQLELVSARPLRSGAVAMHYRRAR
jgi:dihydrofolate reductase